MNALVEEGQTTLVEPAPPKPIRRQRRSQAELEREWRVKAIEREHKDDGKSKVVNLQRTFLTKLRVSQDAWEEIRARVIERTCAWAVEAEERALKAGRKTIQLEDLI